MKFWFAIDLWEEGWLDIDIDALGGWDLSEILQPDSPVNTDFDGELPNVTPSKFHFHSKTVSRSWQVLRGYWCGSFVSIHDFSH